MTSLFHSFTVEGINDELVIESLQTGTIKDITEILLKVALNTISPCIDALSDYRNNLKRKEQFKYFTWIY
jgi:hypothetical protein